MYVYFLGCSYWSPFGHVFFFIQLAILHCIVLYCIVLYCIVVLVVLFCFINKKVKDWDGKCCLL